MTNPILIEVRRLASHLTVDDQLTLIAAIAGDVRRRGGEFLTSPKPHRDLQDAYKGLVREDLDLDSTLREIRSESRADLDATGSDAGGSAP